MAGRRGGNWRSDLSVDRFTPDELLSQDLRQQRLQQQVDISPLEEQYKRYQIVHMQAEVAKAQNDMRNETQTQQERAAFYNGLDELKNYLNANGAPVGTRQHAEAFATYAAQFPLARSSADIQKELETHGKVADDQAALEQRIRALAPAPEKIAERYANVQGKIVEHEALLQGDIARQAAANKKPNTPYDPAFDPASAKIYGNLQGAKAEKAQLERDYPQFLQPQPVQQPSTIAQPPATPVTPEAAPPIQADIAVTAPAATIVPVPSQPQVTPTPVLDQRKPLTTIFGINQ